MSDSIDHDGLYRVTEAQAGYFTAGQAIASGMDRSTLSHHARAGGRYVRIRQGLYRLRQFPPGPHEEVVAAWLPVREIGAVVSHESALELLELSDVIPNSIHLSLPRSKRGQRPRPGVQFHMLDHPPEGSEVRTVGALLVTSPERTIVDALESGTQLEQIELAIQQAFDRGLTTPRRLRATAAARSARVRDFIDSTLARVQA